MDSNDAADRMPLTDTAPVWLFGIYSLAAIPVGLRFYEFFSSDFERRFGSPQTGAALLTFALVLVLLEFAGYYVFFDVWRRAESLVYRRLLGTACCQRCGGLGRTYFVAREWDLPPTAPAPHDLRTRQMKYRGAKATVCTRCHGTRREPAASS